MSHEKDGSALPPTQFMAMMGGNPGQGGWAPNQGYYPPGNVGGNHIIVCPLSGQFLEDLDVFSKMDPFCEFRYGQQLQKSSAHQEGGKTPKWKDVLTFNRTADNVINVRIQDEDITSNDLIGDGQIFLNEVFSAPGIERTLNIPILKHGKNAGTLLVSVKLQ